MPKCEVEGCTVKNAMFNMPGIKKGRRCAKHKIEGMISIQKKCDAPLENGTACGKALTYGFPGKPARKCKTHHEEGMINLRKKKCDYVNPETKVKCEITAGFGFEGGKKLKCNEHKLPNMINLTNKTSTCNGKDPITGEKCPKRATFGMLGEKPTKCKIHKSNNMQDLRSKRCEMCDKRPTQGYEQGKPKRCKDHATSDMKNVTDRKCIAKENGEQCTVSAHFNKPGEVIPSHCAKHKEKDMVDVRSKKCSYPGCDIKPTFNFEGLPKKTCKKHKEPGMIRINNKTCEVKGCTIRPCYNYENEKKGIRCMDHALRGMIDVTHRKCENCDKRAFYNFPNEKLPIKCREHKLGTMVILQDVNAKKCETENCGEVAKYGLLFGEKRHCFLHKSPQEFRRNNPICKVQDCEEKACCTNNGSNYPDRCPNHGLSDDVNIVEKECSSCHLQYPLNEKTGLCDTCNSDQIYNIHRMKEKEATSFLQNKGVEFMTVDRIPENSFSKFRPDAVINFKHFVVIIEIDEYQHQGYEESCEKLRMMQLHQDYNGLPVVFIRFNPDNYKIRLENGQKKVMRPSNDRLLHLLDLVRRFEVLKNAYSTQTPLSPLSVCYLYYDGYNGNPKLEVIDILAEVRAQNMPVVKPTLKLKIIKQ